MRTNVNGYTYVTTKPAVFSPCILCGLITRGKLVGKYSGHCGAISAAHICSMCIDTPATDEYVSDDNREFRDDGFMLITGKMPLARSRIKGYFRRVNRVSMFALNRSYRNMFA